MCLISIRSFDLFITLKQSPPSSENRKITRLALCVLTGDIQSPGELPQSLWMTDIS